MKCNRRGAEPQRKNAEKFSAAVLGASASRRLHLGFTMIELFFGLLITSLVMGAVATFSLAMGKAWQRSEEIESLTLRARQATVRIAQLVRDAKLLVTHRAGSLDGTAAQPAAVIIWTRDTNGDGLIQGAELALIEHNTTLNQLVLYPGGQGDTVQSLTWALISDPTIITDFKKGRTANALARGVYGARFAVTSATSTSLRPTFEFSLKFWHEKTVGGGTTSVGEPYTEYGTCVVRAPKQVPS